MGTDGPGRYWFRASVAVVLLWFATSPFVLARNPFLPQSSKDAKKDYALIYGTVWGPDNHPVGGVPIKIRRSGDKKPKWELVSDHSGEFAQRVPPGEDDYIIQADIKVPKGEPKPEVSVHIDGNERRDVGIHLTK